MVPPTGPLNLDVEAISGICGSVSIACWVVVFSPQIIENFRRGNADGLSLQFIIVWLAGDVFNILGAVLQGVLPTMIILAVYYTIADIVLLGQCFYYRGFTWHDDVVPPKPKTRKIKTTAPAPGSASTTTTPDERTSLLSADVERHLHHHEIHRHDHPFQQERRRSSWSGLSPAVPFVPDIDVIDVATSAPTTSTPSSAQRNAAPGPLRAAAFNALAIIMVCAAGVAGWYLSSGRQDGSSHAEPPEGDNSDSSVSFSVWGQVFGYLCALLYLGSRLPQLLLNWRRQSTEGVSMLFFLFACLGNLTYVMSIFAYDGCSGQRESCTPASARAQYGRYLLVNLSWLAGSLGTLLLDMGIFVQFFLYRVEGECDLDEGVDSCSTDVDGESISEAISDDEHEVRDERPLLRRNMSSNH